MQYFFFNVSFCLDTAILLASHQREGESGRLYHFFWSHPQTRLHISQIRRGGNNRAHKAKKASWSTLGKSKWTNGHPSGCAMATPTIETI